jgi:hypothetical protein
MRSFFTELFGISVLLSFGIAVFAAIMWLGMHDGPSPFVDNNTCVIARNGGTVCGPRAP